MNLLSTETSPYLRQHENNPVHWMPWGDLAFAKAQETKKPVLLSIGYAACHWCHVMAHESFEDAETARLINAHFIAVKVDREERPDIDLLYQQALAVMGLQGGWPLTLFLAPDGRAFWGGTYFPPVPKHGLSSFGDVLRGVARAWAEEQSAILHNTEAIEKALAEIRKPAPGPHTLTRGLIDSTLDRILARADLRHGGFGEAPKFPQFPLLSFLWDAAVYTGRADVSGVVVKALDSLCQGGIYDHIGGGLARYSVDAAWHVPHFEKMLGDNAQFIHLLSDVFRETQNPLYAARARETISFWQREMMVEYQGVSAFASSLDADSNGIEGGSYIWSRQEVEETLRHDTAAAFCDAYDIRAEGNWLEQKTNIPHRLTSPAWRGDAAEDDLADARKQLLERRMERPQPARDDKILADQNALMVQALCHAAFTFADDRLAALAAHVYEFLKRHMRDEAGTIFHSFCEGRRGVAGFIDDYAQTGLAALSLFELTGDDAYATDARLIAETMISRFLLPCGRFSMVETKDTEMTPAPPVPVDDGAIPAGAGAASLFLARLCLVETNLAAEKTARKSIAQTTGDLTAAAMVRGTMLRALVCLDHGHRVAVPQVVFDIFRHISLPYTLRRHGEDVSKIEYCTQLRCQNIRTDDPLAEKRLRQLRRGPDLGRANDG